MNKQTKRIDDVSVNHAEVDLEVYAYLTLFAA
jgi:hypothetical protein